LSTSFNRGATTTVAVAAPAARTHQAGFVIADDTAL
jgi:hypothetical protein